MAMESSAQSPFFIAEELRSAISPSTSRPSTANTNPFSTPSSNSTDLSPPVLLEHEPIHRQVAIARLPDAPRASPYYGSRAVTLSSRTSSGIRIREGFAAPPSRPLTVNSLAPSISQKKAVRMRSSLLDDPSTIDKPWIKNKDPYARVAYFLTYGVAFLGIVASAIRCYFGYKSVPVLSRNLCMVLDEQFDTDTDTVFGSGGNWFREIELGGFG